MGIAVDKGSDIVTAVQPTSAFFNDCSHRFAWIDRRAHRLPVSATRLTYSIKGFKNDPLRNRMPRFAFHAVAVCEIAGAYK